MLVASDQRRNRSTSVFLDVLGIPCKRRSFFSWFYSVHSLCRWWPAPSTRPSERGGIAGISTPWALRASQRRADAHPRNRRRHTDCGLRIGHGRGLLELVVGAAAGGSVRSRGKLRPRRARLE